MKNLLRSTLLGACTAIVAGAQPALTIYNQDFAVVRERLPLELKLGETVTSFAGVTARVEPDSVVLRDAAGKVPFRVVEQSYRADTMSAGLLLSLNEGKTIPFLVRDRDGKEYSVNGKVVRSGYTPGGGEPQAPIVEVDGQLRFSLPGEPVFPALGDDAILKPTLSWVVSSDRAAKVDAELGYVTGGLRWEAAYNLVSPEKGDLIDIVGWVTFTNESGKTFENASIKLMAGEVNKVQPAAGEFQTSARGRINAAMAFADAAVTEKAFDEFHLYTLPRATTLRDRETKQVEFIRATGVTAPTLYVFDATKQFVPYGGQAGRDPGYGSETKVRIAVMREIKNTEANKLGLPLPAGRTRFYRADDADKSLQFTGENTIAHTARGETLRIYTGDAFDLVGERKRVDFTLSNRNDQLEETIAITLRNRKSTPVEIRVVEHLYRGVNWQVIQKTDEFTKVEAQTIEFRAQLKPDEERTITYRVRYDWK